MTKEGPGTNRRFWGRAGGSVTCPSLLGPPWLPLPTSHMLWPHALPRCPRSPAHPQMRFRQSEAAPAVCGSELWLKQLQFCSLSCFCSMCLALFGQFVTLFFCPKKCFQPLPTTQPPSLHPSLSPPPLCWPCSLRYREQS